MDLGLKEKVIIITGGAKGIGGAISKVLAEEGAVAVIAGRKDADNQKTVRAIEKEGGKADSVVAELTHLSECKNIVDETIRRYGRIDGVVNNAGVNDGISLEKGNPDAFYESLNKNIVHYYAIVHYALPFLKKTKGGILNISSKVAMTGQGNTSGYAAANGGINALTREWAVELLPYAIRVNAIVPAEVWTPQYGDWIKKQPDSEKTIDKIVKKIPFENRFTTAEEIADTAAFLLSKRSSHTTGQILVVDGGYVHLDRAIN
ncbi:MAG TPA: SDR family oxidoreductase [Chitinophagaceae bacterium]|nr:SDR family oxidoreductase [Chitinophagaceae bacterium]